MRIADRRNGAVLLEVIVALALLALAGLSAMSLVRQGLRSVETAQSADARVRGASALLDVATLWPREDLDLRIGNRRQGPWMLYIDHPTPTLYRLAVYDSTGKQRLLETAVFRPISSNGSESSSDVSK